MHNNSEVEQYNVKEFYYWMTQVGQDRAEALLRRSGISKSMAYLLTVGKYPHRIGRLHTMAIKKAMLKK